MIWAMVAGVCVMAHTSVAHYCCTNVLATYICTLSPDTHSHIVDNHGDDMHPCRHSDSDEDCGVNELWDFCERYGLCEVTGPLHHVKNDGGCDGVYDLPHTVSISHILSPDVYTCPRKVPIGSQKVSGGLIVRGPPMV